MNALTTSPLGSVDKTIAFIFINLALAAIYFSPALNHGGQGPLLFLFLLSIPLLLSKQRWQLLDTKFVAPFIFIFMAAIPLAIKSSDGEAIDAPSRFLIVSVVFIAFYGFKFDGKWILRSAMLASALAFLFAVYETSQTGTHRVNLGIGILESGYTLAIMLFACMLAVTQETTAKWKSLAGISTILCVIALLLTGARGAWLAVILTSPVFILLTCKKNAFKTLLVTGVLLILTCTSLLNVSDTFKKRVNSTVKELKLIGELEKSTSTNQRLIFWLHAWEGFKTNPITGISYQENASLRSEYSKRYNLHLPGTEDGKGSSHNEILNAMVQKGIIGLAAILLIYLIPLRHFLKKLKSQNSSVRSYSIIGICTISVIAISGLTEAPLMHGSVSVTYGMMLILLYHAIRNTELSTTGTSTCSP